MIARLGLVQKPRRIRLCGHRRFPLAGTPSIVANAGPEGKTFLMLVAAWARPGADLDGDGDTGITDFLALLANWDPCA